MEKKIRPLQDRILVQLKDSPEEEKTAAGIFLPEQSANKTQYATVLAVGPGKLTADGKLLGMSVRPGDNIYFGKYSGNEIKENLMMLREDEVLAVVD